MDELLRMAKLNFEAKELLLRQADVGRVCASRALHSEGEHCTHLSDELASIREDAGRSKFEALAKADELRAAYAREAALLAQLQEAERDNVI